MFKFRFYEIWREPEYLERLFHGALLSVELTVAGGILGFALAMLLATGRRAQWHSLSLVCSAYIELIRNTPLIVQLFFVTFGLPMLFDFRAGKLSALRLRR